MCQWRDWCGVRLEEVADLSLLSGVGAARRRLFKSHGIDDLHDLAALDWRTGELLRCKVDLADLAAKAEGLPASTPMDSVIPNRKKQLAGPGITRLPHRGRPRRHRSRWSSTLCAAGGTNLSTQIELARARVGPSPAYRRRGVEQIAVPRGDVEVDVDMENTNDGCYLWGALFTDRRQPAPTAQYVRSPPGTPTSRLASWSRSRRSGRGSATSEPGPRRTGRVSGPTATARAQNRAR